jgi:hypothetical protein
LKEVVIARTDFRSAATSALGQAHYSFQITEAVGLSDGFADELAKIIGRKLREISA